jgi:DNA replication protein DnaC
MPGLAHAFEVLARQAREGLWSPEDYLRACLAVEIASRTESAVKQRIRAAAFPELKTLDELELDVADGVSAAQVVDLACGDRVRDGQNVLLAGPRSSAATSTVSSALNET